MSQDRFQRMTVARVTDDPRSLCAPAYAHRRALINGRWHVVSRQYSFGCPLYYANPIVVVLHGRADAAVEA
jgi:hypothetical protein